MLSNSGQVEFHVHRLDNVTGSPQIGRSHQPIQPYVQGPSLTDTYAQSVGLSEIKVLTTNPASTSVLKHASDLHDGEEVAVRLMPRGPTVRFLIGSKVI